MLREIYINLNSRYSSSQRFLIVKIEIYQEIILYYLTAHSQSHPELTLVRSNNVVDKIVQAHDRPISLLIMFMSSRGLDLINHTITEVSDDAHEPAFIPDIAPNLMGTSSPQQALLMAQDMPDYEVLDDVDESDSDDDDDGGGGEDPHVEFRDFHQFLTATGGGLPDIFEATSSEDEFAAARPLTRHNSISLTQSQRSGSARLTAQPVPRFSQPSSPVQTAKATKSVSTTPTTTAAAGAISGDTEPLFFTPSKHGFWAVRVPKSSPSDQRLVWYRHVGESNRYIRYK